MPDVKIVIGAEDLDSIIEVAKSVQNVVCIDFWAPWCGPCRMMSPVFEELSDKYSGKCVFVKIDVDKSEVVAQKYSVRAMPTFVIVKDGEKTDELVGASKEKLEAMIQKAVASLP